MGWFDWIYKPAADAATKAAATPADEERKRLLNEQAAKSGAFADQAEAGYGALGGEANAEREYLRRYARGQDSVTAEQLRQGLQQNVAAQRSLAAGAAPQNAAMAARTAARETARLGSGFAGQAALAGMQERAMWQKALQDSILQQRAQDLAAAGGARQTATSGYGAGQQGAPEKSWIEKYGPLIQAGAGAVFSDERLKADIEDGDDEADAALKSLRAVTFRYKNPAHGRGRRTGILAQDLERAGLKHAVIETPAGKAVDGAELATANTAMLARLGARLSKLEGRAK